MNYDMKRLQLKLSLAITTHVMGGKKAPYALSDHLAFMAVEQAQKEHPDWRFRLIGGDEHIRGSSVNGSGWIAQFVVAESESEQIGSAFAQIRPVAICLAVLRAYGVETEDAP